jgi:ribosomal protein L11 methyltransferase
MPNLTPQRTQPLWQIELKTHVSFMDPYLAVLEEGATASSWQLYDEDTHIHFQAIYEEEEKAQQDHARLLLLAEGIDDPHVQITRGSVPDIDWVAFYAQSTPAFTVDKFYIYGSHLKHLPIPEGLFPLWIDAATAFGSGEHHTTSGCLSALTRVAMEERMREVGGLDVFQGRPIHNILDMGCGTGILAIGAHKLWPDAQVTAGDIDAEAVRVTQVNVERNQAQIDVLECKGFISPAIQAKAPFDLIVANILAAPLCEMAPHMREACAPGGQVILSGLLYHQEDQVTTAYVNEGFKPLFIIKRHDWHTLVLGLPL